MDSGSSKAGAADLSLAGASGFAVTMIE